MKNIIVFSVLFLSSCGTSLKTNLTNHSKIDRLNDKVLIIYNKSFLPKESIEIGNFKIGDTGFSVECSKEEILNKAKNVAKTNNANIILVDKMKEPNFLTSCYRLSGRMFYNNTATMNEFLKSSNSVFDQNADYALVHFIAKKDKPFDLSKKVRGVYTIEFEEDGEFEIMPYSVQTKKVKLEGRQTIEGSSYTKSGELTVNLQHGHEYFISVTGHTTIGTKIILEELSNYEGKRLKQEVQEIATEIRKAKLQRQKEKEKRKQSRKKRG